MDLTADCDLAVKLNHFISCDPLKLDEGVPSFFIDLHKLAHELDRNQWLPELLDSERFVEFYEKHIKSVIKEDPTGHHLNHSLTVEINFLVQSITQSRSTFCSKLASRQIPHWLFQLIKLPRNNPCICLLQKQARLLTNYSLRILLNILRYYPSMRSSYKKSGGVRTLLSFLSVWSVDGNQRLNVRAASSYMPVRVTALLLLSILVNEDENEELHRNDSYINVLIKALNDSLNLHQKRPLYSPSHERAADELLVGLKNIAGLETNKKWLVGCGAMDVLKLALDIAFELKCSAPNLTTCTSSDALAELALECLWSLAFEPQVYTRLAHDPDLSQRLNRFSDDHLWSSNCCRTSRNILHFLTDPRLLSTSWTAGERVRDDGHSQAGQLVVVYEQGTRRTMLKLLNQLDRAGYLVWMDFEDTYTVDVVARAISRASGLILGLSHAFKLSPYCRYLTQYAHSLGLQPFPVHLEPDYKPDGWLGLYTATLIYIQLTEDSMLPQAVSQLVSQLGNVGLRRSCPRSAPVSPLSRHFSKERTQPIQPAQPSPSSKKMRLCVDTRTSLRVQEPLESCETSSLSTTELSCLSWLRNGWTKATPSISRPLVAQEILCFERICNWDSDQVSRWLEENGLSAFQTAFSTVDGPMLAELARLRLFAPNYYLASLDRDMGMSVMEQLRLSAAFTKLALEEATAP
ncbi:hypothetical protein CRM22_006353 [Opisthorchis felineus]|uniref:TIR domain-containing protein n=1 Tax=Opisthorchis felineus TaxID=147828 RepID=A0A4S2LLI9_OPIFE|nr:hypothetical protein CRM22_006353 [Opisthorchis felineus]